MTQLCDLQLRLSNQRMVLQDNEPSLFETNMVFVGSTRTEYFWSREFIGIQA